MRYKASDCVGHGEKVTGFTRGDTDKVLKKSGISAEWVLRGDGHLVVRRDQEGRGRGYSQVFSISVQNRKSGSTENLI